MKDGGKSLGDDAFVSRVSEVAASMPTEGSSPQVVDYLARDHQGQRIPFHAILSIAAYILLAFVLLMGAAFAIQSYWGPCKELVSTHAILPEHRLNEPVTALAVERRSQGRERLLVADKWRLFIATPLERLWNWQRRSCGVIKYWQWFPVDKLGGVIANSVIRGLSAADDKLAIVAERDGARALALGQLPNISSPPGLWNNPVIDATTFPGITDESARAILLDAKSGERLVGGKSGVAPYDPKARSWKSLLPSQPMTTTSSGSQPDNKEVFDLASLGAGMFATLGVKGVEVWRRDGDHWEKLTAETQDASVALVGATPVVGHFTADSDGAPPGVGSLTYLTQDHALGQLRLDRGAVKQSVTWIAPGRADKLSRESLTRAAAGTNGQSAWMLYRAGGGDDLLGVAHYLFADHRMLALDGAHAVPAGSDALIAVDPVRDNTVWVGGNGVYAVRPATESALQAVNTNLDSARVDEITVGKTQVFAAAREKKSEPSQAAIVSAEVDEKKPSFVAPWSTFVGARRLESPLSLSDITAATDALLPASPIKWPEFGVADHDSLVLGTRKDGVVVFDRASREMFSFAASSAAAAVTEDLHARGPLIVQVAGDHSVNLFDGTEWRKVITASASPLAADQIKTALALDKDLVLSDGQAIARYSAERHEWHALPPLQVSRMAASLGSLWAVGPNDVLYKLPLDNAQQWKKVDDPDRVIDFYADAKTLIVITQHEDKMRVLLLTDPLRSPTVIFESNETNGSSDQWRAFAVRGRQLYVAPHADGIGTYDAATHTWSTLSSPPDVTAASKLALSSRGLWLLDGRARVWYRPEGGAQWTMASDHVSQLRGDGQDVSILADDGRVLASSNGDLPLNVVVGDGLSAPPGKIAAGALFNGQLIVASDTGVHRYNPLQHSWENAAFPNGPIVEFARSATNLYARSRAGEVWRLNGAGLSDWQVANDPSGSPISAKRLVGSDTASVAVLTQDGALLKLSDSSPTRAEPILIGSRLHASGAIAAAVEVGSDLAIGTIGGAVSVYGAKSDGPRVWFNDLVDPAQTNRIRSLIAPPGRTDRLVVFGADLAFLLHRQKSTGGWDPASPVFRDMKLASVAVDSKTLFGLDARANSANPLARADLDSGQESPIIGKAFPVGDTASPTRAVGVAPGQTAVIWRADNSGKVAGYDPARHGWDVAKLAEVDRFFVSRSKLWSWSRARGELASNEGADWSVDKSQWREIAQLGDRLLLLRSDGAVMLRDPNGEHVLVNPPPPALPISSPADLAAAAEYQGILFLAAKKGAIVAYESAKHRWQAMPEPTDVVEFAEPADKSGLFARTSAGVLWRFDASTNTWRRADFATAQTTPASVTVQYLTSGAHVVAVTSDGHLFAFDGTGRVVASYRSEPLAGDAHSLKIAAAAEVGGNLLLVARVNDGAPGVIAYAPDDRSWRKLESSSEPLYFLKSGSDTWLVERQKGKLWLQRIVAKVSASDRENPPIEFASSLGPYNDVSTNGQTIVAMPADSTDGTVVVEVAARGPTPLGILNSELPKGRQVVGATAVSDDCVVLLDDGSVEHYTPQHRWIARLAPSPGEKTQLGRNSESGEPIVRRGERHVLSWDAEKQSWLEAEPGEVDEASDSRAKITLLTGASCHVVDSDPNYVFERRVNGVLERLELLGSRVDVDTVQSAYLAGDELYLVTPVGTRRFARQFEGWKEESLSGAPPVRPAVDPLGFSGERFSGGLALGGNFNSTAGPLRLALRAPDGKWIELAPYLTSRGVAFSQDTARSAFEQGDAIYTVTPTGVARLTTDGSKTRVAQLFQATPDLGPIEFVRSGQAQGRNVVIDRSGAEWELSNSGALNKLTATAPIEEPAPPLTNWRLDKVSGGMRLSRVLPDKRLVVASLTEAGFGFDRVWAVGGSLTEARLYTRDGLIRIAADSAYENLPNLDASVANPAANDETAELLELSKDGQGELWAHAKSGSWRLQGGKWIPVSPADFTQVAVAREPMFWNDGGISWSRSDEVVFALPDFRAKLHFDAGTGRFDADQPTAIAADSDGVAVLTPAGVVRFSPDNRWRSVTWPEERTPKGLATFVGDTGRIALRIGDVAYDWNLTGWAKAVGADAEDNKKTKNLLLDGKRWRVARKSDAGVFEMRPTEAGDFASVKLTSEGRWDFETIRDIILAGDGLWSATQFGLVECDPPSRTIKALRPTEQPAKRLAAAAGQVAAELDDGSYLRYADSQWLSGGSAEAFAASRRRVVEDGPWHWSKGTKGPVVSLDPTPADGLWRGSAPVEIGFSNNRFAFDAVTDAAFAGHPWLATGMGLIARSGQQWSQVEIANAGELKEGEGWNGAFAVATLNNASRLFARIGGQLMMYDESAWKPAVPNIAAEKALLNDEGAKTDDFLVRRAGDMIRLGVRMPDDPPGRYIPAEIDPTLKRFRHDAPSLVARADSGGGSTLFMATQGGGIVEISPDALGPVRLYGDAQNDGVGVEPLKALVYLSGARRMLALDSAGRIKRLDVGQNRWVDGGDEDQRLLEAARRTPYDDPQGWRIELTDNDNPRILWKRQAAVLTPDPEAAGGGRVASRFAHDYAHSAFLADGAIKIGTAGGIVTIPLSGRGEPTSGDFTVRSADVLTPDELASRSSPRGVGFLRPDRSGEAIYATREADGRILKVSSNGVQFVAPSDPGLAESRIVARDALWTWTKTSSAPAQMKPSSVFRIPADYDFLNGRTWAFLDQEKANRAFPHHTIVAFRDDLFMATAGGVVRLPGTTTSPDAAAAAGKKFVSAVYAQAHGQGGDRRMTNVVELYLTSRQQLMARTKNDEVFAYDSDRDDWFTAPANADPGAELWRVADTPLLDWRFDETGRQNIVVRPLAKDLPDQSSYPLFVDGRFAFDDARGLIIDGDSLLLATGGGVCAYDRRTFAPQRFLARAFQEAERGANGGPLGSPAVREIVRDPDAPNKLSDRLVARTEGGKILESIGSGDFHVISDVVTDGMDVFDRAYTREIPSPANNQMRAIQYPYGSARYPKGAVRFYFQDGAGRPILLGRTGDERALPLFSHSRFAFDDVIDAALQGGRLMVATPAGIVTHDVDWEKRRAAIVSIEAYDADPVPGQTPALHDLLGVVAMPNGDAVAWNADDVFRWDSNSGKSGWTKTSDQKSAPVRRMQVVSENGQEWRVSIGEGDNETSSLTRWANGQPGREFPLGSAKSYGDISHLAADHELIYLPLADYGLLQVEKAKIR
jgi:hypothetical protein